MSLPIDAATVPLVVALERAPSAPRRMPPPPAIELAYAFRLPVPVIGTVRFALTDSEPAVKCDPLSTLAQTFTVSSASA